MKTKLGVDDAEVLAILFLILSPLVLVISTVHQLERPLLGGSGNSEDGLTEADRMRATYIEMVSVKMNSWVTNLVRSETKVSQ